MAISGVPAVVMIILVLLILSIERRIEYETDLIALETTGDLDAAVLALTKLRDYSEYPLAYEKELTSDHPKTSDRIRILQKAAEELGILSERV